MDSCRGVAARGARVLHDPPSHRLAAWRRAPEGAVSRNDDFRPMAQRAASAVFAGNQGTLERRKGCVSAKDASPQGIRLRREAFP